MIDAGMFDGALGIISAISAVKVLNVNGQLGKLKRPVEVVIHRYWFYHGIACREVA